MNRPSPWRVRVSGPLQAYVVGFRTGLFEVGYSERACAEHLLRMARLSRWLAEVHMAPGKLGMVQVEQFLAVHRNRSWVDRNLTRKGMRPLLDHLRGIGVVPAAEPAVALRGRHLVIEQFVAYLATERGLTGTTVDNYRGVAGRFLNECGWEIGDPVSISGVSVNAFVLGEAARRSSGSLNTVTTALRALLRFLYLHAQYRYCWSTRCRLRRAGATRASCGRCPPTRSPGYSSPVIAEPVSDSGITPSSKS